MALNANAMVTLANAKSYLKIPALDLTQDAIIEFFINAASDYFESETNRVYRSKQWVEMYSGRRNNMVLLRNFPVTAIAEVCIDNSNVFDASSIVSSTEYFIADEGNSLSYKGVFPSGYSNIRVTYTAGYAAIPSDIQNTILWLVSYYVKMRDNGDIGRTSKGKGDESVSILQEAPMEVKNCFSRYRRVECIGAQIPVFNG